MILDVGCRKSKRGDIDIDYSKNSEVDIIAGTHCLPLRVRKKMWYSVLLKK